MTEVNAPFKKRRSKYMAETTPAPLDPLLRPLSPISPPLPEDSLHPLLNTPCGSLLPNGLAYSPMPSLPASRCNTPLQFEVSVPPHAHTAVISTDIVMCLHQQCPPPKTFINSGKLLRGCLTKSDEMESDFNLIFFFSFFELSRTYRPLRRLLFIGRSPSLQRYIPIPLLLTPNCKKVLVLSR